MKPVVLDVTRTLCVKSIATPTGIDRVERAYIEYFLKNEGDVRFLYRDAVIDAEGMSELFARVRGEVPWGARDLRATGRGFKGQIEADIRRVSGASLPGGFTYLNVGHTNLETVATRGASRVIGLVHDLIPISHPQFQTDTSVERFETRMRALAGTADLIQVGSRAVLEEAKHTFQGWGAELEVLVNPLGVHAISNVDPIRSERPSFVILGTIEPRKNHALLLDVWEEFGDIPEPMRPILHIIGRRGWLNDALFARLDRSPLMGRDVIEHGSLPDDEVAKYLRGADALLFPSFVEGYGLPLLEALSIGLPTLVSDLPVFRELAGALSLYLNPHDVNDWRKAIMKQAKQGKPGTRPMDGRPFELPDWTSHFARLERHL